IPTEWKPEAVKHICVNVLPEQLEADVLLSAKEIMSHFVQILGEDEVLTHYKSILLIINNCI
ncbi:MAG: DUF7309 domain-containing protein, partial [Turicibacter sp.]